VFPTGESTVTWTAEDASGNTAVDTQTVTVLAENEIAVTVELMGVSDGPFDRCITFEVTDCDSGITEVVEAVLEFNGRIGTGSIGVPCDAVDGVIWDCITARDRLHTLRRTQDLVLSGNQYLADFTGSEALVGGNLNDDQYIDVLDFGTYSSQFGMNVGADTDCSTPAPHGDISGNGTVDTGDFTFIQQNFLQTKEADCDCGSPLMAGDPAGPRSAISVAELIAMDMAELVVADLNADGMLDVLDMIAFINGDRPSNVDARFVAASGSWFDGGNWAAGEQPGEDTNVVIDADVLVDRAGAVAGTVSVASGGRLHLANGTLDAGLVTVHAGGVLQLDGASVLSVNALNLQAGSLLAWNGGLIEIVGGSLGLAEPDMIVGTTDLLSSLSLLQGASAAVGQDAILGLGAGHAGLVEVDGGSALLVGRTTYVGFGGQGTLLVTNGGLAAGLDATLGLLPGSFGQAVVSGVGSTWTLSAGLTVGGQGSGELTVADGGTVQAQAVSVGHQGRLAGDGIVAADVTSGGVLEPTGVLRIDGDYHQTADGAMVVQLGGAGHRTLHADAVTLGGTLEVTLAQGASLRLGDRFRLVTAGVVDGAFEQLDLPVLGNGLRLNVTYGPDSVDLTVVRAAISSEKPRSAR
jgi:T5SS/PEP-CTERM-associated repeat protein